MTTHDQQNGNTQLNAERNSLNRRVEKFSMLSRTKKVRWESMRRHRTI